MLLYIVSITGRVYMSRDIDTKSIGEILTPIQMVDTVWGKQPVVVYPVNFSIKSPLNDIELAQLFNKFKENSPFGYGVMGGLDTTVPWHGKNVSCGKAEISLIGLNTSLGGEVNSFTEHDEGFSLVEVGMGGLSKLTCAIVTNYRFFESVGVDLVGMHLKASNTKPEYELKREERNWVGIGKVYDVSRQESWRNQDKFDLVGSFRKGRKIALGPDGLVDNLMCSFDFNTVYLPQPTQMFLIDGDMSFPCFGAAYIWD